VQLIFAESLVSSAVVIEGVATFANSTFVDCTARLNAVSEDGLESRGGAISVLGGGKLGMQHCSMRWNKVRDGSKCCGGALIVSASSAAELVDTELKSNLAIGGRIAARGGAVCVRDNSSMKLLRSTLAQNVADGSKLSSSSANGGAVFIGDDSVGEVSESEIVENAAREALNFPTGGAFYVTNRARLVLTTSKVNHNVADGGGGGYSHNPAGGAIYLYLSEGEIVNCDLLKNIVRGGKFANAGTNPKSQPHRPHFVALALHALCVGAAIRPAFEQVPCMFCRRD
jgi:hypothetical protein